MRMHNTHAYLVGKKNPLNRKKPRRHVKKSHDSPSESFHEGPRHVARSRGISLTIMKTCLGVVAGRVYDFPAGIFSGSHDESPPWAPNIAHDNSHKLPDEEKTVALFLVN